MRSPLTVLLLAVLLASAACSGPSGDRSSAGGPAAEAALEASAPAPPPEPEPLWKQHIEELQPEIEDWARAWSNQDVEAYLSHYSPNFVPPRGMSRGQWESQRRQRLTAPSSISVAISGFQRVGFKRQRAGDRVIELVKVQFRQAYESDTYSDEVDKVLQLELVDLNWKIVTETSL